MKSIIIGLVIVILLVPVSTVMITEPKILGLGTQSNSTTDDRAPISTMYSPRIFIYFYNELWDCRGVPTPVITVRWEGTDGLNGVGIDHYDVQLKKIYLGPYPHTAVLPEWEDWQMNTTNTSAELYISACLCYQFRCRAIDHAGNVEPWPQLWDTYTITIGIELPPEVPLEIQDKIQGWKARILNKVTENLELIRDDPGDRLLNLIWALRTNQAPIADAGGDSWGAIDKSPKVIEDISDISPNWYAEVEFNGSGSYDPDGEIIDYLWNFGDGSCGHGECVSHRYMVPGEYNVTLTVTDNYGAIDQDSLVCAVDVVY